MQNEGEETGRDAYGNQPAAVQTILIPEKEKATRGELQIRWRLNPSPAA
jgi:hypothetical protein